MEFWGDFQGVFGETRGGRVVKNHEKWGDVFYGWSLKLILLIQTPMVARIKVKNLIIV